MIENTVYDGKNLERIFQKQEEYMNHLVNLEAFPKWPLDINIKSNQAIIKDIIDRGITELSEGYEVTQKITKILINNSDEPVEQLIKDFNEELADGLHFFVEAMILIGITAEDVHKWYIEYLKERELESLINHNNTLSMIMGLSNYMNVFEGFYKNEKSHYRALDYKVTDYVPSEVMAGRKGSMILLIDQARELWMITHAYKKATNLLKKKKHRKSGKDTNLLAFAEKIMEAFCRLFKYYNMTGATEISLYENYTAKNEKNIERIKNEY